MRVGCRVVHKLIEPRIVTGGRKDIGAGLAGDESVCASHGGGVGGKLHVTLLELNTAAVKNNTGDREQREYHDREHRRNLALPRCD